MKGLLQGAIRGFHSRLLNRGLPNRLGLYFHNVELSQRQTFSELVGRIKGLGYRFVDADEYVATGRATVEVPQKRRNRSSAEKLAFVSFDDNYFEWYESLPLLDSLQIRCTFYVNTAPLRDMATDSEIERYYSDRLHYKGTPTRPLSMNEVRSIRDAGHTIGVHSHNHFVLSELPFERAKEEIYICSDHLEQALGQKVKHFSYPFGMRRHFTPELREYCLDSGFESIARATPGLLHQPFDGVTIQRTNWRLEDTFDENQLRFSIDGRLFERVTGRSAVA